MSRFPEPTDPDDWQPATSRPGELFTIEGQIRASGVFLRGLKNHDPRLRPYRRSMWRTGLAIMAAGGLVIAAIAVLNLLL